MEKKKYRNTFAAFLCAFSMLFAYGAYAQELPSIEPSQLSAAYGRKTSLSVHDLVDIALIFSGAEEQKDKEVLYAHTQEAMKLTSTIEDLYEKGERVLEYMHRAMLKTYSETQTRIDTLLRNGTYNCVSSAVLYLILGTASGLNVSGVNTKDHAFCSVEISGTWIDVETTNKYGFDPGKKKEFKDSFGNTTGFSYVPPGNYGMRTSLDAKGLLSLILHNRIAEYERQSRFDLASGLAADRYAFLATQDAYRDMMRSFSNFAAYLNSRGQYDRALGFIDSVRGRYGKDNSLAEVLAVIVHNYVLEAVNAFRFDRASAMLEKRAADSDINPSVAQELRRIIGEKQISRAVETLPFDDALSALESAYAQRTIQEAAYKNYARYLYSKEAARIAKQNGFFEAGRFLLELKGNSASDAILKEQGMVYIKNHIAQVHNTFADLYNAKRFEEARSFIEKALSQLPDEETFKRDLQFLNKTVPH